MKRRHFDLRIYVFYDRFTGKRCICYRRLRADGRTDESPSRSYEGKDEIAAEWELKGFVVNTCKAEEEKGVLLLASYFCDIIDRKVC